MTQQVPVELADVDGEFVIEPDDSFEAKVLKMMLVPCDIREQMVEGAEELLDALFEAEHRLDTQRAH